MRSATLPLCHPHLSSKLPLLPPSIPPPYLSATLPSLHPTSLHPPSPPPYLHDELRQVVGGAWGGVLVGGAMGHLVGSARGWWQGALACYVVRGPVLLVYAYWYMLLEEL
mmetsp:Transcript_51408/g.102310  ORF Transcript_51408/g.102310 Transcript_51408/m.102310 type:complete len:110 (+) Transcript_51408:424-753(+)